MKQNQGQNGYVLLKLLTVNVAKQMTLSVKERNLIGKLLSDNDLMPEFVNYVDAKKLIYMRFMQYEI